MSLFARLANFAAGLLVVALAACEQSGPEFAILSGSENEVLEPLVQEFCKARHAKCTMKYLGSLDIALTLKPDPPRMPTRSGRLPRCGSTCTTPRGA
jgi:Ca-activated chloride channel family protein